jgi:hypothetical protein
MRILLYASPDDSDGLRLERLLGRAAPHGSLERFDSLGGLSQRLQSSLAESRLAVLVIGSQEELLKIASFQPAFEGAQLLLVLPDQDHGTLSVAHQLRPRYVTYRSEDFADLLAVVQRKVSPGIADPVHSPSPRGRKGAHGPHGR